MTDSPKSPTGFTRLRALLFLFASLAIGAVLIVAMTWFVVGSAPRSQAVAIAENIEVAEYATLPDDKSYPAALALGQDGTLYTGSYQTGALWAISSAGVVSEIPGSRERIGSVTGLDIGPDGALIILDRIATLDAKGAIIWRYADGELNVIVEIPNDRSVGLVLPDDIAVDSAGRLYVTDRDGKVSRYTRDGEFLGVWWWGDCREKCSLTGIAYDPVEHAMLITDSGREAVFRVGSIDADFGANTEWLYYVEQGNDYGFDGITVTADGEIYVALLGWNRVARLEDGALVMLAKDFRGASDLVYDPARDSLFVTNWNQFGLGFGTRPQLPFAIDVIDLSPERD